MCKSKISAYTQHPVFVFFPYLNPYNLYFVILKKNPFKLWSFFTLQLSHIISFQLTKPEIVKFILNIICSDKNKNGILFK